MQHAKLDGAGGTRPEKKVVDGSRGPDHRPCHDDLQQEQGETEGGEGGGDQEQH